ncbi:pyruvate kinase [Agrobacterium tumefaciens]|uniref:pyruvate kinase n=1 Tax=Agrobacterium tumefaciens TaxID=358 RepID=UPI001573C20F|nr:pyruvate kinase [Agrobacterium tumefaciens]NTB99344.1 pyruvate kinase [Agrobacterium tumefaciens]NTC44678.1 pyruvate kinase [Agrobacterium tumefaciens]
MHRKRQAKIVATVGPASASPEMLKALFLTGVDTFRLNFSHGSHEDHARVFHAIRTIEREIAMPIGILQDLQGPKIRLGRIAGGLASVSAGDVVRFVLRSESGETSAIPLPHPEIFAAVKPGDDLLIDDGRIRVRLLRVGADELEAEVIFGGTISDRKGVNIPGTVLDISPLTTKDRNDLAFGLDLGVDWVALSFVQKPGDLIEARGLIGERAGLVAKIEKPSALEKIDDIISLSDVLMVARGDLGVEIPAEEVPGRQKELVRACRQAVKPVIVATQMLDSMVSSASPTRAEASDVAMAIYDGADAVMLSAETATGRYPVETVEMMDRIIRSTEGHKLYNSILRATEPALQPTPAHAVAGAAADVATAVGAPAIVAFTSSGVTAARIARERPSLPIVAITADMAVARRLCLLWGAISLCDEDLGVDDRFEQAAWLAKHVGLARAGDNLVIVSGIPFGQSGTTNNLRVARL